MQGALMLAFLAASDLFSAEIIQFDGSSITRS